MSLRRQWRLRRAVLCADCDVITDSPQDVCLVCGIHSLLPLARVLGSVDRISALSVTSKLNQQLALRHDVLVLSSPISHKGRRRGRR